MASSTMPLPHYHTPYSTTSEEIAAGPVSTHAAIAGGVVGSLSAVAVMGVVALLLWRRRRRKREWNEKHDKAQPTGPFSFMKRSRTEDGWRDAANNKGTPKLPEIAVSTTPIIEDNLIRMSLAHWERPYAHEDPFKEKDEQLTLRVTNPDPVRSPSPLLPTTESPRGFMQRQRTALAAALATFKRTASSQSLAPATPSRQPTPVIAEHLSQDLWIPPAAYVAGTMLRPSDSRSSDAIYQQPPSDPFLRPPESASTPRPLPRPPIRHVASRTPSYNDRPFTVLSSKAVENASRTPSPDALSYNSYNDRRLTGTSDPFEIDPRGNKVRDGGTPNWTVHTYDGT